MELLPNATKTAINPQLSNPDKEVLLARVIAVVLLILSMLVVGLAGPAAAEDVCIGEEDTAGVCYNPDESIYLGCFYLADDQCTPVYAPTGGVSRCWLTASGFECSL